MAEDTRAGDGTDGRPARLLSRAIQWLDRTYWARDDDIAHKMKWQVMRGRRGRRRYRDLRFDVLLIVREARARRPATLAGRRGAGGPPPAGPFHLC